MTTRRGLSLLLALAIAAGPSLCCSFCCFASDRATTARPTKRECSCCRPTRPAEFPREPAERCPCRDHAITCCSIDATPIKADNFDPWFASAFVAADHFAHVPPPPRAAGGSPLRELPFLSVSDLLHVQHRLRC